MQMLSLEFKNDKLWVRQKANCVKAYHFELEDGERGTLAGCDNDCTLEDAREWIEFFYRGRVVEVRQAGIVMNAPPTKDLRASYIKAMRRAASGCAEEG